MKYGAEGTRDRCEELPLAEAAEHILEECRMVLPGMQALFGFQLIAVFGATFSERLDGAEQCVHLLAIALVTMAIAMIMTPAAYHRQTTPTAVTDRFVRLSTRMLLWSMVPLALGICLDFALIARVIIGHTLGTLAAAPLVAVFVGLWFVLPRMRLR